MNRFIIIAVLLCITGINFVSGVSDTRICFEFKPEAGHEPTLNWLESSQWCWAVEVPYYFEGSEVKKTTGL